MAVDTSEIVVAGDASVHVGAVGSTGPSDIATALDAAFTDLGYTSEDGIEWTPGIETNPIRAHQALYAVRYVVTGRTLEFGFELLQWNQETLKLALGGGSVATTAGPPAYYTYTPPEPEEIYYRALVLQWEDGDYTFRLHVPKVMVTETSAITLARTDAAGIPLTMAVVATDGVSEFTLITVHPAFA